MSLKFVPSDPIDTPALVQLLDGAEQFIHANEIENTQARPYWSFVREIHQ